MFEGTAFDPFEILSEMKSDITEKIQYQQLINLEDSTLLDVFKDIYDLTEVASRTLDSTILKEIRSRFGELFARMVFLINEYRSRTQDTLVSLKELSTEIKKLIKKETNLDTFEDEYSL